MVLFETLRYTTMNMYHGDIEKESKFCGLFSSYLFEALLFKYHLYTMNIL